MQSTSAHQLHLTEAWDAQRRRLWFGRCSCGQWLAVPSPSAGDLEFEHRAHRERSHPGVLAREVYVAAIGGAAPERLVEIAGVRPEVLLHAAAFDDIAQRRSSATADHRVVLRAAYLLATAQAVSLEFVVRCNG